MTAHNVYYVKYDMALISHQLIWLIPARTFVAEALAREYPDAVSS